MNQADTAKVDADMMRRCLALSKTSGDLGEYPYAAVICRNGQFVCESTNRVTRDRDATRHAEVVALSEAQKILGQTSLDDCAIYVVAEPCAYCCYAIRETRIRRVVFGLKSPVMGGHSRWDILGDNRLSETMPEVFAPPPAVVPGFMQEAAAEVFNAWNPLIWEFMNARGLFVANTPLDSRAVAHIADRDGIGQRIMNVLRWFLFDRIGRR